MIVVCEYEESTSIRISAGGMLTSSAGRGGALKLDWMSLYVFNTAPFNRQPMQSPQVDANGIP